MRTLTLIVSVSLCYNGGRNELLSLFGTPSDKVADITQTRIVTLRLEGK
jgi:hypothetical protein